MICFGVIAYASQDACPTASLNSFLMKVILSHLQNEHSMKHKNDSFVCGFKTPAKVWDLVSKTS